MNTDTLLDAISRSSAALFGGRGMERAVARLARGLGEAAGAGRAYFVENRPGPRGGPAAATVCEWVAPGAAARFGASGLRGLPPPRMGSLPERMRRGPFHGLVGAMPRPIRGALRARRALSVAIAPVRAGAEWHGFLGLEDCSAPRRWSKTEMAALRVAAGVLGAAIGSRRAGERLRSVLEGGMDSLDTGLIILDRSFRVVWMNRTMERFLGIGRSLAYELVRRGEWPTTVLHVGKLIKIPTEPLVRLLGAEREPASDAGPGQGASHVHGTIARALPVSAAEPTINDGTHGQAPVPVVRGSRRGVA